VLVRSLPGKSGHAKLQLASCFVFFLLSSDLRSDLDEIKRKTIWTQNTGRTRRKKKTDEERRNANSTDDSSWTTTQIWKEKSDEKGQRSATKTPKAMQSRLWQDYEP
jgi:hypothetical protein